MPYPGPVCTQELANKQRAAAGGQQAPPPKRKAADTDTPAEQQPQPKRRYALAPVDRGAGGPAGDAPLAAALCSSPARAMT